MLIFSFIFALLLIFNPVFLDGFISGYLSGIGSFLLVLVFVANITRKYLSAKISDTSEKLRKGISGTPANKHFKKKA
ncbi:MAG: hypothetical protein ACKOW9_04915 [Candidatus Paceibacterota bacterium]